MHAGHEQHGDVRRRRVALQDLADAKPVDPAQQEVEDDGVRQFLARPVQSLEPVLGGEQFEAFPLEPVDERPEAFAILVGDEDPPGTGRLAHATLWRGPGKIGSRGAAAITGCRGIRKRKVLPRPGTLSTQIWPPCNSTKRLESARPRPMPS